ncbi:MBL fold metallo-hydrolase [Phycicoccus sp. DTK01]|uniref:MBL fold metallo-hydrolase n=1 Tax=Phycicoccus sp. DTK01 TaxID=2785745 RepID=UPI001AA65994|nr:MBL fold metallo-hydrolase [Phycicoccus sp. DTK01]GIL36082.1 Zn-dependent hydrolase [Phycicoccus sp. DTK01]
MSRLNRLAVAAGAASALGALAAAGRGVGAAMGARPDGVRLERMRRSPHYRAGAFHNRRRGTASMPTSQRDVLERYRANAETRRPAGPIPVVSAHREPATEGLHVTWFGHASALVELDGVRLLLDPVWSERCSPSQHVGPRRLHATPVPLEALGRIDAVVISHDHYDHLDMASIQALAAGTDAVFVVPLGIGAHLDVWGVPGARVVECDWGEGHDVRGVRVTAVESQHFSGRGLRRDGTLWASWVFAGPGGRVFFSGDTGYFDGYAGIGAEHGPFDVSLMAVGAYDAAWRDIHLDPEEAVRATVELGGGLLLPIHWCTFVLAPHPWAEPVERLLVAAATEGVQVAVPRVGDRVDVADPPGLDSWWEAAAGLPVRA